MILNINIQAERWDLVSSFNWAIPLWFQVVLLLSYQRLPSSLHLSPSFRPGASFCIYISFQRLIYHFDDNFSDLFTESCQNRRDNNEKNSFTVGTHIKKIFYLSLIVYFEEKFLSPTHDLWISIFLSSVDIDKFFFQSKRFREETKSRFSWKTVINCLHTKWSHKNT